MNRLYKIVSKQLIIALGILTTSALVAQEESKTFQERFNVAKNAVLDINTSYADIEFETWNKDEVAITATITLEGASKEEAEAYFKGNPIEILGNSKKVTIASTSKNNRFFSIDRSDFEIDHNDLHIEIPEIASFVTRMPQIAPLPPMPPLPQTEAFSFDYEAYQKDGDKYMKEWQKNFEKSFDKEHQKRLEEWAKQMEAQTKKMEIRIEEQNERRMEQLQKRAEQMEKRDQERQQRLAQRNVLQQRILIRRDSLRNTPNIFYLKTEEGQKNYKVKKSIKIKLPKSTRIQMDVRHGEVKLATNTENLNAKLSHSSLWAATIDGHETNITALYSPVNVQQWNYGQLSTSYSEEISLSKVVQLQLEATSSDVTIDKIIKNAYVKNNFGAVHILELDADFEELDMSIKNGELNLALPNVATKMYVKGNSSSLKVPNSLTLAQAKNGTTTIHKGFHINDDSARSIIITSDYSEVVIQ